jgi:hypothetical protein
MNHPWMTKGFNTVPENYLPHREPVQLPLDPAIVEKMTGFDFGSADFITRELTRVINSDDYQAAVRLNAREQSAQAQGGEKRRGVFDFYKRRSSTTSRDTLPNPSVEAVQLGSDPVNAFSPLISIYYLVREKQERERVEANPGALSMPMSPGERPLKLPDLPAPEAAYTNPASYEMPGEKATGGRSRPRSRTHGEDDIPEPRKIPMNAVGGRAAPAIMTPPTEQQPAKKENTAVGLLRRFSTRRNREPPREKSDANPPSVQLQPPSDSNTPRKSFSVRRSRHRENTPAPLLHPGGSTPHQNELLTPPILTDSKSKNSNILDRSTSVNSADVKRRYTQRGASEGHPMSATPDPPPTSGSDRSSMDGQRSKVSEPAPSEHKAPVSNRASTSRTKSLGHARRESIQARRARREEVREANLPEETGQELADEKQTSKSGSMENIKPVYLKGLFSVSTTSNKPLAVIRADIIRVLKQLGVDYTEIKGGFSCRHAPSIDLNRVVDPGAPSPDPQGVMESNNKRRISFGGFRGGDRDQSSQEKSPQMNRGTSRRQAPDTSFTNSEESAESVGRQEGERPAGETTTHVQSELGGNMVLRFEIFIVKVPLFSLHGIQFKKVSGGTWQYKNMAQKILDALRL